VEVLNQREVENAVGLLRGFVVYIRGFVVYIDEPPVPGKLAEVPPSGPEPPSVTELEPHV
jgi:hypothetical protein